MKPATAQRALSPIFASLMLLGIIATLFIPTFIWTTGTTTGTKNFWDTQATAEAERITLEEASLNTTKCVIYVRNIGKPTITIDGAIITSTPDGVHIYDKSKFTTKNPPSGYAPQGDLLTIAFPLGFTPRTNTTYTIKAYTPNGASDTYQLVMR